MSEETNEVAPDGDMPLAAEELFADWRDTLLDEVKAMPEVWQKLGQQQQDELIERVDLRGKGSVKRAARAFAAHSFAVVAGELEGIHIKKGKARATVAIASVTEGVLDLADMTDEQVLIVLVDERQFMVASGHVKSDPDQADLPLADGPLYTAMTDEDRDAVLTALGEEGIEVTVEAASDGESTVWTLHVTGENAAKAEAFIAAREDESA